jgi:hypothetical protein
MSVRPSTGVATHTIRGVKTGAPSSSSDVTVTIPRLEAHDITNVDAMVETGLAPVGGPVVVVFENQFRNTLLPSGAYVFDVDRVRFTVSNLGSRVWEEREVLVRLYPQGRRRSLFPEIQFEDLRGII